MYNKPKSATTAGLLGIFLGAVGAHNWYLGEKKKGIIHLCLVGGAILLMVIASIVAASSVASSFSAAYSYSVTKAATSLFAGAGISLILEIVAALVAAGNGIWGLVEGIVILAKGDAGLAQKGYATATAMPAQPVVQENWQGNAGDNYTAPGPVSTAAAQAQQVAPSPVGTAAAQQVAPKPPMDPAKKAKLTKLIMLIAGGVVAVIAVIVVVSIVSKVNYGETYRVAKELKPEMSSFYSSNPCEYITKNYNKDSVSKAKFEEYASECIEAGEELKKLADELKGTSAVKKDKDIKTQFEAFYTGIDQVLPSKEDLETKVAILKAWHNFVVTSDELNLTYASPESGFRTIANELINSGIDVLKVYGEGYLEHSLNLASLYRTYDAMSYSDPNRSAARQAYNDARTEFSNWVAENKPSIEELAGINTDNVGKLYKEWNKLYEMITTLYEKNYESGSGDCVEFLGEVECS